MAMTVTREQFDALQSHAAANYNTDGWDRVVECYDLSEVQAVADLFDCQTYSDLLREVGKNAKLISEVEEDGMIGGW